MKIAKTKIIPNYFYTFSVFTGLILAFIFFGAFDANAASLSVSPTTGSFPVDETFDVSLFLNTEE